MSQITETNARNQLVAATAFAERLHNVVSTDSQFLLGFLDIAAQLERGDFSPNRIASQSRDRRFLASAYAEARAWIGATLVEYAALPVVGRPTGGDNAVQRAIDVLHDYFVRNDIRIVSRGLSFATPTAVATPAGDGFIRRLNLDRFGLELESQTPDIKQAEVLLDQGNGASRFSEVFEFRGTSAPIDLLEDLGVGGSVSIAPPRIDETRTIVRNPHFDQVTGTPEQPLNWTVTGTVTPDSNSARQFAVVPGESTPRSLQIAVGGAVEQQLVLDNNARFDPDRPYHVVLAYNVDFGSADGTLRVTMGLNTVDVDLSTASAGWNQLEMGTGTDAYYDNFRSDNLTLKVELIGGTGGTFVNVDNLRLAQYRAFDGGWYMPVTGEVPFEREDLFQWEDTEPDLTVGLIQRNLWRLHRRSLPSGVGSISGTSAGSITTIADPSLVLATLASDLGVSTPSP